MRISDWSSDVCSSDLWTATYSPLPSQVVRSVHVGFLLLLLFGIVANAMPERKGRLALFAALGIVSFLIGLYHWIFYVELVIERAGDPNLMDIVVGTDSIELVFLSGYVKIGRASGRERGCQ